MSQRARTRFARVAMITTGVLVFSACGGNEGTSDASRASATKGGAPAASGAGISATAARLTPAYLDGRWCYEYVDFGEEREDVATEYVFAPDGSLQYQVSRLSEKMDPGTWEIGDGRIRISPTLVMFDLLIEEVGDNAFVLNAMGGRHHFRRGRCAE